MGQVRADIGWERAGMDQGRAVIGWERADRDQERADMVKFEILLYINSVLFYKVFTAMDYYFYYYDPVGQLVIRVDDMVCRNPYLGIPRVKTLMFQPWRS